MWDSAYTTPQSSDIAMALIRHQILDIRKQNGKAVQRISLPKQMELPAWKENLGKMKEKLAALEALQDPENSK